MLLPRYEFLFLFLPARFDTEQDPLPHSGLPERAVQATWDGVAPLMEAPSKSGKLRP